MLNILSGGSLLPGHTVLIKVSSEGCTYFWTEVEKALTCQVNTLTDIYIYIYIYICIHIRATYIEMCDTFNILGLRLVQGYILRKILWLERTVLQNCIIIKV